MLEALATISLPIVAVVVAVLVDGYRHPRIEEDEDA